MATTTSFIIRPSTIADTETLGIIHSQAWQETYAGLMSDDILATMGSVEARTARRRDIFAYSTPQSGHFIVESGEENIIGFGDCGPSSKDLKIFSPAEIYTLYLLRRAQGKGMGRTLLTHMFEHLRTRGFDKIGLHTHADSRKSNCFYEHLGGQKAGMIPEKYPGHGAGTVYIWTLKEGPST